MNTWELERAFFRDRVVYVQIDGHRFFLGEKYTIIEMGLTVVGAIDVGSLRYFDSNAQDFLFNKKLKNPSGGELPKGFTDDSVLVALAYQGWWTNNGERYFTQGEIPIPTRSEAEKIVRGRKIVNCFNSRFANQLAGEAFENGRYFA